MSLPTLPHPVYHIVSQGGLVGYMSAEQMQAYGQQCREAALEEAVDAIESENARRVVYTPDCIEIIRSLK